ncbi:hypothetical protein L2E82_19597 [Cichorium intybus]|uniref:Uncharacterized protein n=1 Tax=Cichorium intybus TaxID=13427 RepID=A0ACB9FC96_CICIN|nr:hypothetical protein L2E82_19597 [Cichorium intybus]
MTDVRVDGELGCGVGLGLFKGGSGPLSDNCIVGLVGDNGIVGSGTIGPANLKFSVAGLAHALSFLALVFGFITYAHRLP